MWFIMSHHEGICFALSTFPNPLTLHQCFPHQVLVVTRALKVISVESDTNAWSALTTICAPSATIRAHWLADITVITQCNVSSLVMILVCKITRFHWPRINKFRSISTDLYFAGETLANDLPHSYTCPFCGRLGFTDSTLYEHVNVSHNDNSTAVVCIWPSIWWANFWLRSQVCPICATFPGVEPNQVSDDFLNHLNVEHRNTHELISFS